MEQKQKNRGISFQNPLVYSLRARVTAAVLLPLFIILGTSMFMQYRLQNRMVLNNLTFLASQTALTIEHSLQEAMLQHRNKDLQDMLDNIGQNEMLRGIYLIDPDGKIVFSSLNRQLGVTLTNQDEACLPCHSLPAEKRPASVIVTMEEGERFLRSMNPIPNKPECQECHKSSERLTGVLMTDISIEPLEQSLRMDLWQYLLMWATVILVSMLVVNLVINRFVLRRLDALSIAIHKFGLGHQLAPLPVSQTDEIGQVSLAFNQMAYQVETRNIENRLLSEDLQQQSRARGELLKQLITAQEDERMRIARELHDEMGQSLAVLALQLELARKSITSKPEQSQNILEQSQTLVGESTERMYNMILALRPSDLDDLGLAAALRTHGERVLKGSGITLQIDASLLTRRLPRDLETALYRVFQEGLTNVFRHSRARKVSIRLSQNNGYFLGEIADDGDGFNPQAMPSRGSKPGGLGLAGLRERVQQHNGQVEIWSQPGQGTRIKIRIPIEEERHG